MNYLLVIENQQAVIESLREQLTDCKKQNVMLRDAIDSAINGLRWWMDAFPMHVTEADNEEMLELVKALAEREKQAMIKELKK